MYKSIFERYNSIPRKQLQNLNTTHYIDGSIFISFGNISLNLEMKGDNNHLDHEIQT